MTAQLYINGKQLDLNTGETLTLNVKSNLLNDISKWTASTSYTFKIPTTARNMAAIDMAGTVGQSTQFPYLLHAVDYVLDGVTLIHDGAAAVHAITADAIELTITFGLAAFDTVKELALNEMTGAQFILFAKRNKPTTYAQAKAADFFFAALDMEIHEDKVPEEWEYTATQITPGGENEDADTTETYKGNWGGNRSTGEDVGIKCLHPSAKAAFILKQFQSAYGLHLNYPQEAKEYIDTLIMPLVKRKANWLTWYDGEFKADLPENVTTGKVALPLSVTDAGDLFEPTTETPQALTVAKDMTATVRIEYDYDIDLTKLRPNGRGTRGDQYTYSSALYMTMSVKSGDETTGYITGKDAGRFIVVPTGWKGKARMKIKAAGNIELKQGDQLTFRWGRSAWLNTDAAGTLVGGKIDITYNDSENVPLTSKQMRYPIMPNLPEVKALDFLKFLCAVTGTFPLQMKPRDTAINFATYDTLADFTRAVDWSARLHSPTADSRPDELTFAPSDWAQHNYYKWKDDDTVTGDHDADIYIPNEALTAERTVVTFPFAATDGNNVPCYTFPDTSGSFGGEDEDSDTESKEPTYKACKDRILRLVEGADGEAAGVFDISMTNIIADKYAPLTNALQNAKVIKANIRLTPYDIAELDESRPIYLKQYGSFFALLELKYSGKETTECTLLRLIK